MDCQVCGMGEAIKLEEDINEERIKELYRCPVCKQSFKHRVEFDPSGCVTFDNYTDMDGNNLWE